MLCQRSIKAWAANVLEYPLDPVKTTPSARSAPTLATLKSIPWSRTKLMGVYGIVISPIGSLFHEMDCRLYVRAAGSDNGDLGARFTRHRLDQSSALQRIMKDK